MRYRSFSLFGPQGANPWAKVYQKGRRAGGLIGLSSYKISSPYVNLRPRYPLPNFPGDRKTNKNQTVNDISQHAYQHVGIKKKEKSLVKYTRKSADNYVGRPNKRTIAVTYTYTHRIGPIRCSTRLRGSNILKKCFRSRFQRCDRLSLLSIFHFQSFSGHAASFLLNLLLSRTQQTAKHSKYYRN